MSDDSLSLVKKFCVEGWPEKLKTLNSDLKIYYKINENLFIKNDLVFYNDRLVIPKNSRALMLEKLHLAHLGMEKTKARARKFFYWPGLTKDIEDFISKCKVCLKFSKKPCKELLIQHERPNVPFLKVGADILYFGGKEYLAIVDYFSNWIELHKLNSKTSKEIINVLKNIFAMFGIPLVFIADNQPFNSAEFHRFAKDWEWNLK